MREARGSHRAVLAGVGGPIVALSLLAVTGCGGDKEGPVAVDQAQQRQIHNLVTQDYANMYRERYAGKRATASKAKRRLSISTIPRAA